MDRQEKIDKIKELVTYIESWAFIAGILKEAQSKEIEKTWELLNKFLEENI